MKYLTEEEFDRRYLIKRTVARTFLKSAAEKDDLKWAERLTLDAAEIFRALPVKKNCATVCCSRCNGLTDDVNCEYGSEYGQLVFIGQTDVCRKCGEDWEPHIRYQVYDYQL